MISIGDCVRVTGRPWDEPDWHQHGAVFLVAGITPSGKCAHDEGGRRSYLSDLVPWVPEVGERVRYGEADDFVVSEMTVNVYDAPLVMRKGRGTGYLVHELAPVLDAAGFPVRALKVDAAAFVEEMRAAPPDAQQFAGVTGLADVAAVVDAMSRASHCGRPWHAQPCGCATGWVRPAEAEPEGVHEMRTFGGVTLDVGAPGIHPRAETVWRAFGNKGGRYVAVDHPTREGAIAAWRGAR